MYRSIVKRIIDVALSFIALVVLSPVIILLMILIKIDSRGPVIFKQKRVGIDKTLFTMYKFRSMKIETPEIPTYLLDNPDVYITRVGKILRKSSLDELPQILNILKGDMSIVGPRPALWNEYGLIQERDKYGVNNIRPGLTGWAQINGRDELYVPAKVKYDGEYMESLSLSMDFKCFIKTIPMILKSEGNVEGGVGTLAKRYDKG